MSRSRKPRTVIFALFGAAAIGTLVAILIGDGGTLVPTIIAQVETKPSTSEPSTSMRLRCDNSTLNGRYAFKGDGVVPGEPSLVPFGVIGIMTFDGAGNFSNAATASNNGIITRGVRPGTYSINSDCTGTLTVTIPFPPFELPHDLVITDGGDEFYFIQTGPSVVTLSAKRL